MKKSLALVARKKQVAAKRQGSYSKMAKTMQDREMMMRQQDMDMKREEMRARMAKKKTTTKSYSPRQRRFGKGNPKGGQFAPTGASLAAGARMSAVRMALAKRAKTAAPYAKAALAGAGEAVSGISAGRAQGKVVGSLLRTGKLPPRNELLKAAGQYAIGRAGQNAWRSLGNKNLASIRSNRTRQRVERFGNIVRTGVRVSHSAASTALSAYRFYHANRSTIDPAIQKFLGKELNSFLVREKAKRQASYDSLREAAVSSFRAAYPYTEGGTYRYVHEVWPGYMVVDEGGKFFKVPYTDEGVSARTDWEEVERQVSWEAKEYRAGLTVFKGEGDTYRWVLLSSNGFRDKDGEIVSTKALQHDVALWDLQDQPPQPLRWWHVHLDDEYKNGLDLGQVDFRMVHGHTLIESGSFLTKEIGEAVYNAQDKLAGSIGFRHSQKEPDSDKIFNTVRIFERSLLPKESASNPLTHLAVAD